MTRRLLAQAVGFLAGTLAAAAPAPAHHAPRIDAIRNVHVVDVDRGLVSPAQTVLISNGRISHIGPARSVPIRAGAKLLDGAGRFLIPGLIDTHVHLWWGMKNDQPLYTMFLSPLLSQGITTVR
ncbi:MAG: hypothetical protein M3428_01715, partial [Pseudomonadota bacterium]|nr:hypothetical protein [Pseudomonadota bacterium]